MLSRIRDLPNFIHVALAINSQYLNEIFGYHTLFYYTLFCLCLLGTRSQSTLCCRYQYIIYQSLVLGDTEVLLWDFVVCHYP